MSESTLSLADTQWGAMPEYTEPQGGGSSLVITQDASTGRTGPVSAFGGEIAEREEDTLPARITREKRITNNKD